MRIIYKEALFSLLSDTNYYLLRYLSFLHINCELYSVFGQISTSPFFEFLQFFECLATERRVAIEVKI